MSPKEIAGEIIQKLQQAGHFDKESFIRLLHENQTGFATLQLSDGTEWILRLGELDGRYIHIHPGRYAAHTVRVKASALKTAIAVSIWNKKYGYEQFTLAIINQVRTEVLNSSPIKTVSASEGIGKLIQLINAYN